MTNKPRLLQLADYNDPVLRTRTMPVQFPLSAADQQLIADMIYSIQPAQLKAAKAPWQAAVGMAANQWGVSKSIFLYCPTGDTVGDLEVIINPSYEPLHKLAIFATAKPDSSEWEGCFSVPLCSGYIQRSNDIRVKYQNENGESLSRELSGWEARVWQHENDHLLGFLYDDPRHGKCLEKKSFTSIAAVEEFYDQVREARK